MIVPSFYLDNKRTALIMPIVEIITWLLLPHGQPGYSNHYPITVGLDCSEKSESKLCIGQQICTRPMHPEAGLQ